jgi:dihydroorotase/N-acyl-D-amino-acid deacylase
VMTQLLPQSSLAAGLSDLLGRLHDPVSRASLIGFLNAETAQAWSDIFISALATDENKHLVGKDLASIAAGRNRGPAETVLDLLAEEQGQVNILSFNQSEPNLRELLTHPLGSVISDGFYVDGRPHPRLYATFPLFLGHFCRERKWLSLADAVHKITQAPARRLLIGQRAALVPGSPADLVVFDPQSIGTAASYEAPAQYPCGISLVLRRGKVVQSASSIMDGRASQSRNVALDVLH